jgi:hypothetical protein
MLTIRSQRPSNGKDVPSGGCANPYNPPQLTALCSTRGRRSPLSVKEVAPIKRIVLLVAMLATTMAFVATPALAQASISLSGDAVITSSKVLSVPVTATCDDVGQQTTFILVTVTQPRVGGAFVEGEGSVEAVTCDSTPHTYTVTVPRTGPDRGAWRPGGASLSSIISYCVTENDSFNCTTQAFLPQTTITLVRR